MKRITWLFILFSVLVNCSRESSPLQPVDQIEAKRIAWESLSGQEQNTVTHPWEEAQVNYCNYRPTGQPAICIMFNTTDDALLGPIVVFLEFSTLEVIGYALRD